MQRANWLGGEVCSMIYRSRTSPRKSTRPAPRLPSPRPSTDLDLCSFPAPFLSSSRISLPTGPCRLINAKPGVQGTALRKRL